jgi:hypothetical protein
MLDIKEHGVDAGPVVICDTGSEDEDNYRFRLECELWFGCPITVIKSERYRDTIDVWETEKYISGIDGAPCSRELKFVPRVNFEGPTDIHVFGYAYDLNDRKRAKRLEAEISPLGGFVNPLIERHLTKANCRALLAGAGIEEPRTYAMGFPNANCLETGCGKAQSPRYWALFRKHFPARFARTAAVARKLGVRLVIMGQEKGPDGKRRNIRGYIDDIPLDHPTSEPVAPVCDLLCSVGAADL